jgi:tRNA(Ile)-lysidine synthase TilS/MesJ
VKKQNPKKYKADCIFLSSFSAFPKVNMGIPGRNIYRINPMVEFDDTETYALSRELEIPVVVDICKEVHGNDFEQDRRFISKYLEIFSRNQSRLKLSENSLLYSYRNLVKFMTDIEILPPLEEVEGLIYEAYNSNFDEIFELLKK